MVLARFGPRLPALVEAALVRQAKDETPPHRPFWRWIILAGLGGMAFGGVLFALAQHLG